MANIPVFWRFFVFVLLLACWPLSASTAGWADTTYAYGWTNFVGETGSTDFHVELDERYGISRADGTEVNITDRGRRMVPEFGVSGKRSVGPLSEIYWNSNCIFAKHHGFVHVAGMIDEIRGYWFVIKRGSSRLRGPFGEKKFQRLARTCGVRGEVPWMTVRQAYIWSLETYPDQRWNWEFIKTKLVATFWQGLFLLVVLFPVFPVLGIILYAIDRFVIDRLQRKRWNVWPYTVPGWPVTAGGLAALSFLNETVLLLY